MRVLVVGLGVTGDAVVRHLLSPSSRADATGGGVTVTVVDDEPSAATAPYAEGARRAGATVIERPVAALVEEHAHRCDLIVPSPGVNERHPAIRAARSAGVAVRSEVDLALERASMPVVAVTGTNGKTTVVTLVAAMLDASGIRVRAAGNIGHPLLDAVTEPVDVVVAEVSSFQLELTTAAFHPRVAVLLNVAADHLDWHGSQERYVAAKARIGAHLADDDAFVFNADDPTVRALAEGVKARRIPFSLDPHRESGFRIGPDGLLGPDGVRLVDLADLAGRAPHDRENMLAAAAAGREVGATAGGIAAAVRSFGGLPHRMTVVGEWHGVRFVDDSKATNPHAAERAIRATHAPGTGDRRVVLIAGGRDKGLDLGGLAGTAPALRGVVAIGEAASAVAAAFAPTGIAVRDAGSMRDAVETAAGLAEPGDVVLLSPACASFDWYDSYAARGDDFAREVAQLRDVPAAGSR